MRIVEHLLYFLHFFQILQFYELELINQFENINRLAFLGVPILVALSFYEYGLRL